MNRGILIFALKHCLYGRLAYNLAVSIKAVEPNCNITIVKTEDSLNHLGKHQLRIFDNVIDLPDNIPNSCGAKLWAYDISPYDETLLLDADMLWLPYRKPSQLFEELKELSFTGIVEGYHTYGGTDHAPHPKYFFWAQPEEIGAVYNLPAGRKIYQWRSETIYFKRSEFNAQLFKKAQEVFLNPGLTTIHFYATGIADELGLNIACAIYDVHPHVFQWNPAYWHMMHGGHVPPQQALYSNYYLATFGSNMANGASKDFYNKLMRLACHKLGLQHVFPLQSKRDYIPERQKI